MSGVRKHHSAMTALERDRFVAALKVVKSTGVVERFAVIHERHFNMNIHRSSHFLPWHREMLARFERELQAVDGTVFLPYWDSSVDQSTASPLWDYGFLGQFDQLWGLSRALGSDTLPTPGQVAQNQSRTTYAAFWPELESGIHNPPHRWVGGQMRSAASPRDPVFYLHHAWIDLLWARWQAAHRAAIFTASAPGTGLNDPLMEWPTRRPADVMDHHELGYVYDQEEAQVWHNDQRQSMLGGAWTGWTVLSALGDRAKNLVAVPNTDGRLHAFMIGMDDQVWHNDQQQAALGGAWTGWTYLSNQGDAAKNIAVVPNADGRLHAFMIGIDDQVWHNDQQQAALGGAWTGWTVLSSLGDRAKNLAVAPNSDGRLHAFGIGTVVEP